MILARAGTPRRGRAWRRKWRKTWEIGPLGALNGLRMRAWYRDPEARDLSEVAREHGVPVLETPFTGSAETRRLCREADATLGLSLGNDYIPRSVFSIPAEGMINVHGEVLPRFQGAQSVIWALHEGRPEIGFTVHRVNERIDGGDILYQQVLPMELHPTLRETVERNCARLRGLVPEALCHVCGNFGELAARGRSQTGGQRYTTPSFRQFLRMLRNHRRLYREASRGT